MKRKINFISIAFYVSLIALITMLIQSEILIREIRNEIQQKNVEVTCDDQSTVNNNVSESK